MNDRRFKTGVAASVAWLGISLLILWIARSKVPNMGPNEWGDYLAGIFAPLAFLWLVLGYMQQGEELKQNTEALRLQAEELRNSVEQQRQLVEVSRLQVDAERSALEYEREVRDRANRPSFAVAGNGGSFRGDGQCDYSIAVTNIGQLSTHFVVEVIEPTGISVKMHEAALFDQGERASCRYRTPTPLMGDGTRLSIRGVSAVGQAFELQCPVYRKDNAPHTGLSFGPLAVVAL